MAHECKILSEELGIPNVVFNSVKKSIIKQETDKKDKKGKRFEMENSRKVEDRQTDRQPKRQHLPIWNVPH